MATRTSDRDGATNESECKNSSKSNTADDENLNPNLGTSQANSAVLVNSKTILEKTNNTNIMPTVPRSSPKLQAKMGRGHKKFKKAQSQSNKNNVQFTVCHWNCASGITNKLDDIKNAINELKPTVMYISEADRKNNHDDRLIQIKGYKLHNSASLDKYGKSRIIAYTKDGVNLRRRLDLESPDTEMIIFDKQAQNTSEQDRIIGLYRPFTGPNGDKSSGGTWERFNHLIHTINNAVDGCHRVTIVGDLNVDLLKNEASRYVDALKLLCDENSLEQLIHQPTHIQALRSDNQWELQESLLDHVYSSDYRSLTQCGVMHLSQSDHLAIYATYTSIEGRHTEKKIVYKRDLRLYNKDTIAELCRSEDWGSIFSEGDLQESYNHFEDKLQNIINNVAPMRKLIISEKHPLTNHSLRSLENRRRTLYKKMKTRKTSETIQDYKKIKTKIKLKVKTINKTEVSRMLKSRNMKDLWRGVNTMCGRNATQTQLKLKIPQSSEITADEKECANIFADTFKTKVEKLVKQVGTKDSMTEYISKKVSDVQPVLQFSIQDITKAVLGFKQSSSCGPDGISINFIKDIIVQIAPILKFIFDKAAFHAKSPLQWKTAKIVPIYKKGTKEDPENYRPISLLCSLGKVYEKCILKVMDDNFGLSIPSSFQHGFRKNHSTTTAALTIQNSIARALDKKKKVIVVSTDMSAAFDLLDKEVLLPRMMKMGVPDNLIRIYDDFLSERKAFIQCGQSVSEEFHIPVGCVQGSPSGPYLFTLLVDGIQEYMPDVNIIAYADDMYYVFEADSWDTVAKIASEKTKVAIEWLKKSGMVINASKTEAAYFAKKELLNPPEMTIDGITIIPKKYLKVLGILFDYKLKWDTHVENTLKEANSRTQAIRLINKHLSQRECIGIVHGIFFSKFYYCSAVWLTEMLSKPLMQRLTSASNSCLRAALGYKIRDISTVQIHLKADVLTPYQKAFQDKAVLFWRIINNCEPEVLHLDLLNQGFYHERTGTYYLQQENLNKIGKLAFENRLNNILCLLPSSWLDESENSMKKTLKNIVQQNIPAKCDNL
jgi:hypothetical protein